MNSYSSLVQKTLQIPLLAKQVETLAADHDALNLVTEDWKSILENYKPFQDFQAYASQMFQRKYKPRNSIFSIQNLLDDVKPLKVIVAGYCRMYKPYDQTAKKQHLAVTMSESNLMDMMVRAFTNDVDPKTIQLNPTCKLNLKTCSMFCQYCSKAREEMTSHGISIGRQYLQPCISDTLVFNGQCITNRFGSQIMNSFSGEFISIMKMELNVRYFYSDKGQEYVRVGGTVSKMICFPESNLKDVKVDLGDLKSIAETDINNCLPAEDVAGPAEKRPLPGEFEGGEEEEDSPDTCEKRQKTWEDEYDVAEDILTLGE